MENISTGLKWAIGVIVTLLIVAAGISIYMVTQGYFKRAQEQTVSQAQSLTSAEFTIYDNTRMTGGDVLEAVQKFANRPQFSIAIDTGLTTAAFYATGTGICYSNANPAVAATCGTTIDRATMVDPSQNQYINVTATFDTIIRRDANGEVRLISFTQS